MKKIDLYILPVSNKVIFPYQSIRIRVSEMQNYDSQQNNQLIGIVTIVEGTSDSIQGIKKIEKFSEYGTILRITSEETRLSSLYQQGQGNSTSYRYLSALAFARFRIINLLKNSPNYIANVEILGDDINESKYLELNKSGLIDQLKMASNTYLKMNSLDDQTMNIQSIENEKSINKVVYNIAASLDINTNMKLKLLQVDTHEERIKFILQFLKEKNEQLKDTRKMEYKVRQDLQLSNSRSKKRESMPQPGVSKEFDEFEDKIAKVDLPPNVREVVDQELKKLKGTQNRNIESDVIRSYLTLILELPWNTQVPENLSIQQAQETLDRDHCGLTKVKERILQFLAVRSLNNKQKGQIICFYGPPGVGKTSLGQSIADALGRPFIRMSLGGVHDESSIRGHRRTYVAAMPGQVIAAMRRAKCKNPVVLLDEIDKVGRDSRGDPSSALLEVLDPEQNTRFMDHYLNIEFDLSQVLFIATANDISNIQPALLDRLELIQIPGYTRQEKLSIALRHLLPKQIKISGLTESQIMIEQPELIVPQLIKEYTVEAGVRQLERVIAQILRYAALNLVRNQLPQVTLNLSMLPEILGTPPYTESTKNQDILVPGIARGLAWTSAGGKTLLVETVKMKGSGRIEITGSLGDTMKESVKAALGYIRSNWGYIAEPMEDLFEKTDIHIHFPAGGIPKDGPSAGITIATALASLLLNRKVRNDIAMTGEITLTGSVLPVGGIKEKVLGAYESGIKMQKIIQTTTKQLYIYRIILPYKNQKDISEVEKNITDEMRYYQYQYILSSFFFVNNISEVLQIALEDQQIKIIQQKPKQMLETSKL